MKRLLFFALAASVALAVSCKKDEKQQNSIVFDGITYTVDVSINKSALENDAYQFSIQFPDGKYMTVNCRSTFDGKTIDLTKVPEAEGDYWNISCYGEGGKNYFSIFSDPSLSNGKFQSGTLKVTMGDKGPGTVDFSISLKKGKTSKTHDNNDHTVEIKFNGPVKLVTGLE